MLFQGHGHVSCTGGVDIAIGFFIRLAQFGVSGVVALKMWVVPGMNGSICAMVGSTRDGAMMHGFYG